MVAVLVGAVTLLAAFALRSARPAPVLVPVRATRGTTRR
jgi:hypothetical protein